MTHSSSNAETTYPRCPGQTPPPPNPGVGRKILPECAAKPWVPLLDDRLNAFLVIPGSLLPSFSLHPVFKHVSDIRTKSKSNSGRSPNLLRDRQIDKR
ncbi:6-deoxyerythronolide-B synthase [Anopheles sinensis]|uniref:6-deoxyerythronolide-B synthase n=1 Tax=Anopheles sinensis TaxID=74873 RepID=A0A084VJ03_ANOSI|nr:6-deoxyerythronolide-B synthase [Anopheles sinensis]